MIFEVLISSQIKSIQMQGDLETILNTVLVQNFYKAKDTPAFRRDIKLQYP